MADSLQRKARRIPTIPVHWENYLLCLIFHMLLPLFPIVLELSLTGRISDRSLTLTAAIYAIAIGSSSRSMLQFGLTIAISLIFACAFGIIVGQEGQLAYIPGQPAGPQPALPLSGTSAAWSIVAVFIMHALERYNRHIVDRAPFFEFVHNGGH